MEQETESTAKSRLLVNFMNIGENQTDRNILFFPNIFPILIITNVSIILTHRLISDKVRKRSI